MKKPKAKGGAVAPPNARPNMRGGKKAGGFKRNNSMNKKSRNEKAPSFQGKVTDEVKSRRKIKTKQERKQNVIAKKLQS